MYSREAYEIGSAGLEDVLETFAEMCIDTGIRSKHTLRGITKGVSRVQNRLLLPLGTDGFREFNLRLGSFNHEFFNGLLNSAAKVGRLPELELRRRFKINDLLDNNLGVGETLNEVMRHYGILDRDDYRWHFDLYYRDWHTRLRHKDLQDKDILDLTISDNGDDSLPTDDKFQELCQRLFWNTLDEQSVQHLSK